MRYSVIAPLVIAPDQAGRQNHWYTGQLIPWLPDSFADHLLSLGMVEELPDPVPPGVVPPVESVPSAADSVPSETTAPSSGTGGPERPPQTAIREIWVDYVVNALGVDRAEAEAMTKPDLIARAAA